MKAIIYARVSTMGQVEGFSIPSQIESCQNYAQKAGFEVLEVIRDEGTSGAIPLFDRPNGRRILELAESGAIDALIFHSQDRASRDETGGEIGFLKYVLSKHSVEIHYADRGKDADDLTSNIISTLEAYRAAEERRKTRERTVRGRNQKVSSGKMVIPGWTPYGYVKIDGELHIDPVTAPIVAKMFDWYVSERLSLKGVAVRLNKEGVQTIQPGKSAKNAPGWDPGTVSQVIENSLYCGVWYFGKTRRINGKPTPQPQELWQRVDVPNLAIITPEFWQAAQDLRTENRTISKRSAKMEYLLSNGFFKCGTCGRTMQGRPKSNSQTTQYRCGYNNHGTKDVECSTWTRIASGFDADNLVWGWLLSVTEDVDRLRSAILEEQERKANELNPLKIRLEALQTQAAQAEKLVTKLMDKWEKEDDAAIAEKLYQDAKTESRRREGLTKEINRIETEINSAKATPEDAERLIEEIQAIRAKMENANFDQKRQMLAALEVKVVFHYNDGKKYLEAECMLPGSKRKLELSTCKCIQIKFCATLPLERNRTPIPGVSMLAAHKMT